MGPRFRGDDKFWKRDAHYLRLSFPTMPVGKK